MPADLPDQPAATAPAARAIYKYPLDLSARAQVFSMPVGAEIVHVHEQTLGGEPKVCLWAEVNTTAPMVERTFCVFATGEPIAVAFRQYVGTVHIDWTVWHVYESRTNTRGEPIRD